MISNAEAATVISKHIQESFRQLDQSAFIVREKGSEAEIKAYLDAVGPICADICFKLMEPLYRAHPQLAPEGWGNLGKA
jgi:hypothetical protein